MKDEWFGIYFFDSELNLLTLFVEIQGEQNAYEEVERCNEKLRNENWSNRDYYICFSASFLGLKTVPSPSELPFPKYLTGSLI